MAMSQLLAELTHRLNFVQASVESMSRSVTDDGSGQGASQRCVYEVSLA